MANLAERLQRGYTYIIYPCKVPTGVEGETLDMGDIPVELEKMAKVDEDGNIIGYYSINELSRELGKAFVPVQILDDRFKLIHWAFDEGEDADGMTDKKATIELLESKGLVNMRAGIKEVKDIDFTSLQGNEFGIFGSYEVTEVPKIIGQREEENAKEEQPNLEI